METTTNGHTNGAAKVRTPPSPAEQALQTELQAMRRINRVLDALPRDARQRVINWAAQRLHEVQYAEQSLNTGLVGAGNYR